MSAQGKPEFTPVGLQDVLITGELSRRPSRPPDYEAEARALAALAQAMGTSPGTILQKLVDTALDLCRADSAGISILEPAEGAEVFRWHAIAGQFARNLGGTMPRELSPCGTVIQQDAALLFAYPERHFRYPVAIDPPIVEALLVPFHAAGRPVGIVWAIAHTPERKFDAEDARLLTSLSRFASAAHQMTAALAAAEAGNAELERRVEERTRELRRSEERFRQMLNIDVVGVLVFDASGTLVGANDAFLRQSGYTREEVAARALTWRAMTPPEYVEESERQIRLLEATGRIGPYEKEYYCKDGSRSWMLFAGASLGDGTIVEYCIDINDRKRAEAELREADRRKDEFLAMLGHELRNPLASLHGAVETLQRQRLDGPALERAHAMMNRQVEHLGRLVDDLLDVSRIMRGLVELRRGPVNLAEAADRALEMAAPVIEERRHDLSLTLPGTPLRVDGDLSRLTQVIFNLLDNAAKYTDPGGRLWLSVERDGGQAVVRVRDNGSGMKAALVAKVFDLFTQGGRPPDHSQGGLGLTLVRRLVGLHGGTVEARSDGPGKGSEFVVRLPALPEQAEGPRPAPAAGPPPAAEQVNRALVVDDNFAVAETLTWLLEGLAREVRMVHSGAAAVETAGAFRPDVILCDIGMPEMDGYETCRRLRQVPGLEKALIAAVSGYADEEDRWKSKEAGFDRHLVKPIRRAALEELVKDAAKAAPSA